MFRCSFRAIFTLYCFSNQHLIFILSLRQVAFLWQHPFGFVLTSQVTHSSPASFSLHFNESPGQQKSPTSITAMVIQERLPRKSDNNAQGRNFRREKGLHSSESHSSWVKWSAFKTSFSYTIQTDRGLCLPRFWDQNQNWDRIIMLHYELDGWFHFYCCIFIDFRGREEIMHWNSWFLYSFTE